MRVLLLLSATLVGGCLFDDAPRLDGSGEVPIQQRIAEQMRGLWRLHVADKTTSVRFYDDSGWGTDDIATTDGSWCRLYFSWEDGLLISESSFELIQTVREVGACAGKMTKAVGERFILKIRAKKPGAEPLELRLDGADAAWIVKCAETWSHDGCAAGNTIPDSPRRYR